MTDTTIAFIGAGNMASSIIGGMVQNGWPAANIIATDHNQEKLDTLQQQFGIQISMDNHQAVKTADVIMLSVKPQVMEALLTDLALFTGCQSSFADLYCCWYFNRQP